MKPILSVSRRTDIPAYYAQWWLRAVRRGHCTIPNPVSGKPVHVPLAAEHWAGVVYWTRNPGPLLPHLDELDRHFGQRVAFQVTLNGMPRELERRNPPVELALKQMARLSERYGPRSLSWRFDPIVLTDTHGPDQVLERFRRLAGALSGKVGRCIFSFVDDYRKVLDNFASLERDTGIRRLSPTRDQRLELTHQLLQVAREAGIALQACCEDELLAVPGIEKARCLDCEQLVVRPHGRSPRSQPTREQCACHASRDVGTYDSCPHGCLYCYANRNPERALAFHQGYLDAGRRLPLDDRGPTA
ncbi:MAG: DUF1848 domain-containing protein [Candidatus Cloacimonetes bacterium]|nr:DUF1848 domain-containing protein [Candidatus Cloacimonadota bacterium]